MTVILRIGLIAILIGLVGCYDKAYPPFLLNGYEVPITVRVVYANGETSEGVLQPGVRLVSGREPNKIEKVIVIVDNQVLYNLGRSELLQMKHSVEDMSKIVWKIGPNGIKPLQLR